MLSNIVVVKGMRRTGNNFLIELFKRNFEGVKITGGHGGCHTAVRKYSKDYTKKWKENNPNRCVNVAIIIKNPYSWYSSITSWARKAWNKENIRWQTDWGFWKKQYQRFNTFYSKNLEFHDKNKDSDLNYYGPSSIIKYEDLLKDTKGNVNIIMKNFGFEGKNKIVVPNIVPQSLGFTEERKKFYLSGGTFGLSKALVRKINDEVDWELMSEYGYWMEAV